MSHGDGSARIRQGVWNEFIEPQINLGKTAVDVPIKLVMKRLEASPRSAGNLRSEVTKSVQVLLRLPRS